MPELVCVFGDVGWFTLTLVVCARCSLPNRSTGLLDLLGEYFFDISNEFLVSGTHLFSVCLARGIQEIRTFWETTSGIIPRTPGIWQSPAWCRAVRLRSTGLRRPLGDNSGTCFRIQNSSWFDS